MKAFSTSSLPSFQEELVASLGETKCSDKD